jgi:hypothetical protein
MLMKLTPGVNFTNLLAQSLNELQCKVLFCFTNKNPLVCTARYSSAFALYALRHAPIGLE